MRSRSRRRPQVFKQMNRLSALIAQWHDPWVHRLKSKDPLEAMGWALPSVKWLTRNSTLAR